MSAPQSLTVFCGAHAGFFPAYSAAARDLGERMARAQIKLVYGGGHIGLMGVVADAALAAGGRVAGVIPHDLEQRERAHAGAQEMHVVDGMHERKALLAALGEGFLVLPGGFGTLEESFEVLTWLQLKFHSKPCVFINTAGYFDHLFAFIEHSVNTGFVRPEHAALAQQAADPAAALKLLGA